MQPAPVIHKLSSGASTKRTILDDERDHIAGKVYTREYRLSSRFQKTPAPASVNTKDPRTEAKLLPFSSASIFEAHFPSINGMLLALCLKCQEKLLGG
jgi:hypothetical protein